MKPGVRKRREAAGKAREEGYPTTFYPRLHNEAPWGARETPQGCLRTF